MNPENHQDYPHGFLLGVECDGASYHSAKSARDRDRLRQGVLEGLGWEIHRIWSTNWFQDPRSEVERLKTRLLQVLSSKKAALVDIELSAIGPSATEDQTESPSDSDVDGWPLGEDTSPVCCMSTS